MKNFTLGFFLALLTISCVLYSQDRTSSRHSFMQTNNINTVFIADGVFNLDRFTFTGLEAGLIWPVSSSTRTTAVFGSGIWVGAKVGPQRELRLAAAVYNSHYSPGNIPVMGQVPPVSVCNDTAWKVYLVNLTDASLINGGTRTKIAGGRTYTFFYTSWAAWPVSKGAPYAEINGIPGYQPGINSDRPGIGNGSLVKPDEICFSVFMDYTNCTNNIHLSELSHPGGTLPLGVEIHQIAFAFTCTVLNNMYFSKWRIINRSTLSWDSTYISLFNDADVGNAFDDAAGCDSTRSLSFVYNADNSDLTYGANPPAGGFRILQGPLRFTGNNNDTVKLPYDTLIGYKAIGMSGNVVYVNGGTNCTGDPDNAIAGYNWMRGTNGCGQPIINPVTGQPTTFIYPGNACNRQGWIDSIATDRRTLQNSGPFLMNSGDTQVVVAAFVITRDGGNNFQNVCALQSLSDTALRNYYNNFVTCIPIGIQPISSEVPDRFGLSQNYPNPFNPSTTIRFSIPNDVKRETSNVKLVIFDILGQEAAVLVNEELKAGVYEVTWDASDYPSEVYFYTLSAGNYVSTKKMVLLK